MRHFAYLADADRERLFLRAPAAFTRDDGLDVTAIGLGATLYCPATRPQLARDVVRRAAEGVTSMVICLEDAVADRDVEAAERNLVAQLRELHGSGQSLPMLFVRVRREDQVRVVVRGLGKAADVLTGFVLPKFDEDHGAGFLEAVVSASARTDRPLLAMPVVEAAAIAHIETRVDSLLAIRRLVDKYRDVVPAVRIGATDLSAAWGLRRGRDFTVWDVRVVADVIASVVNVFGRADGTGVVVTGPVWEYFSAPERLFKPMLRESPFAASAGRELRAELVAKNLDGLMREVSLDRANGLLGKTVIHPSHVPAVHALSVVAHEEYTDACDVLATGRGGGAAASVFGNKMNESKPHTAWAERTMLRARLFGVAREDTSFVDLLAAGLHG